VDSIGHLGILLIRDPLLRQFAQLNRDFRVPVGFWFAAQGSLVIFVLLLFWFASAQDKIDRDHGFAEED
jgi:putative solute:sodium symporter small subunit